MEKSKIKLKKELVKKMEEMGRMEEKLRSQKRKFIKNITARKAIKDECFPDRHPYKNILLPSYNGLTINELYRIEMAFNEPIHHCIQFGKKEPTYYHPYSWIIFSDHVSNEEREFIYKKIIKY